ncbi:hypothetical protein F0562_017595 [Nyssa sinensis]|uniref:Uncharacterized protein n=1 Tax=Nyssa sinensis TaxID=561372 RepID=A0A5J4ZIH6_9ASTE|nr:hypothetical protein F0562_017595 [Nyssa sinensis]
MTTASYDLSLVSHTNTLNRSHSTLLFAIATGVPIDDTYIIFTAIYGATSGRRIVVLPFGSLITRIYVGQANTVEEDMEVGDATEEDIEVGDTVEGGGAAPNKDFLVDEIPP